MSSPGEARSESRAQVISRDTPVIFVVDDDVSVRESLELLILCAGWQPETFESAEEFLERSRVDAPSCLVLDVTLPNLNGLVTNQVTTASGNGRRSATRSDAEISPTCDNPTQRDVIR